jgi:hypothetical protein
MSAWDTQTLNENLLAVNHTFLFFNHPRIWIRESNGQGDAA